MSAPVARGGSSTLQEHVMDLNDIDWGGYWDQAVQYWGMATDALAQAVHSCDQLTHWLMNDGASFTAFLAFLAVCCGVIAYAASGRKKQLEERRAGYNEDRFVQDMTASGHDAEVSRTVYQYIQDMHRIDFPILPGDDLYTVLGVTDGDVRRAMPMLLQALGREAQIGRLMKQLTTVEDLVKFVADAPRAMEYVWEREWQTA
jgi:hypothetical protein